MTGPQPSSFRSDQINPADLDRLVEALDAQSAMSGVRRLRAWERHVVAAKPGERVLDVGSGTGSEVQHYAGIVGRSGEAVGVEPNPGMRAVAEHRVGRSQSIAQFLAGHATDLPFADGTFDVVRCERVLQHVTAPQRATAEMVRVLRPGGRIALLDTNWGTSIIHQKFNFGVSM